MRHWFLSFLIAGLAASMTTARAADASPTAVSPDKVSLQKRVPFKELPEEIQKKILEKIRQSDQIPDEVKQKLLNEAGKSQGEETESTDGDTDKAKDGDKKKEESKPEEPSLNDRVKKLREEMQQMDTEFKYKVAQYKQELESKRLEIEKKKLDREITDALRAQKSRQMKQELEDLKLQQQIADSKAKIAAAEQTSAIRDISMRKATAEAQLATRSVVQKLQDVVMEEIEYTDKPYANGVLTISDRRIELNGPIMLGAAKHVCDRINYFNNESDKPIFLVIDSSPGGSAIEGLQIVQSMKNSEAPVFVVVKRFAASMAAIITTLADESFVYPNAIILHHQASSSMGGNTTQQKEQLDRMREMSARLIGEVAKKLGLTETQFVERMYQNRSTGDWDLFGDEAVKQGWANHVVDEIRERAVRERPRKKSGIAMILGSRATGEEAAMANPAMDRYEVQLEELQDDRGRRFVRLPRLSPIDHWLLFNPDQYYR